jgi:hypothetical protein
LPEDGCPVCKHKLNRATALESGTPSEGDVTVCLYCESYLKFDKDLRHLPMAPEEVAALPPKLHRQLEKARKLASMFALLHGKAERRPLN